jgi:hypothetical protein
MEERLISLVLLQTVLGPLERGKGKRQEQEKRGQEKRQRKRQGQEKRQRKRKRQRQGQEKRQRKEHCERSPIHVDHEELAFRPLYQTDETASHVSMPFGPHLT